MVKEVHKWADSYEVKIFIGRDDRGWSAVTDLCEKFCTMVGLCVTVTPTQYAYSGGSCDGVIVGLINYARFPKSREEIWDTAERLAQYLKDEMNQGSFTVQDDKFTYFHSTRKEDGCE